MNVQKETLEAERAIEISDPLLLGTALINGANPNSILDDTGETLLHRASTSDVPVMVQMLLEKGADVKAENYLGKTAAFVAADNGRDGALLVLHKFGADFNVPDKIGDYPIHRAARNGHASALATLLAFKAKHDVQTEQDGATPLHLCAIEGNISCAKMLVVNGAQIDAVDYDGSSPLIWAVQRGKREFMEWLLRNGASANLPDNQGRTPLIWAATKNDSPALINILLQNGADPSLNDNGGQSPLSRARLLGHKLTENVLLEAMKK
jgi:ankyrin repeat protein